MYKIITDSSCDLPEALLEDLDIIQVPFYVTLDGETHQKEKVELSVEDFYQFLIDNPKVFPKTSMPSIQDYMDVFEPIAKAGNDIICLCITTKFSGSYNSAQGAKQIMEETYPDIKITVIDTTIVTVLQGLLIIEIAKMRDAGYSYNKITEEIESLKKTGKIFFTVGSMDYLINGGRVGKLSGFAASALKIKPLILFDNGEIHNAGVIRSRNIGKKKLINLLLDHFKSNQLTPDQCMITVGYGSDREEGLQFKQQVEDAIKETYPLWNEEVSVHLIGATIAVHTGPFPLGIGVINKVKI